MDAVHRWGGYDLLLGCLGRSKAEVGMLGNQVFDRYKEKGAEACQIWVEVEDLPVKWAQFGAVETATMRFQCLPNAYQ